MRASWCLFFLVSAVVFAVALDTKIDTHEKDAVGINLELLAVTEGAPYSTIIEGSPPLEMGFSGGTP